MQNKEREEEYNNISTITLPTGYVSDVQVTAEKREEIIERLTKEAEKDPKAEKRLKEFEEKTERELFKSTYSLKFSYGSKQDSDHTFVNEYAVETPVGKRVIKNKEVEIKRKSKGKLKGSNLAAVALSATGNSSKTTKWELYNSGFWISIKPMSMEDKISLEVRLASEMEKYGIDTMGLIFSNDQAAYRTILLDFLKPYIDISKSSLKFEEGDDPYDYISSLDTDILITALVYNLYPNGFPMTVVCGNNLDLDENGTKCNYILEGVANALDCIYFDRDELTDEQLSILGMGVGTVYKGTEEEYIEDDNIGHSILDYKSALKHTSMELEYKKGDFGIVSDIKLSVGDTTVNDMLKSADKFIVELKTKIDEAVLMVSDEEEKSIITEAFIDSILINKYLHFIKRLDIGDNYSDDMYDIFDALNVLRENSELAQDIVEKVYDWVDRATMSVVGHQKFICSNCKKVINEDDSLDKKAFESIVPFNILTVFTTLRVM